MFWWPPEESLDSVRGQIIMSERLYSVAIKNWLGINKALWGHIRTVDFWVDLYVE